MIPTCDSVHSWKHFSAVPLANKVINTMIWYLTQLHYPDTDRTSSYHILIIPSAWLWTDKYQFLSHWFDLTAVYLFSIRTTTGSWVLGVRYFRLLVMRFYALATSKIISICVPTCASVHLQQSYSATSLGNHNPISDSVTIS